MRRAENIGKFEQTVEHLGLRPEIGGDVRLAERRAETPHRKPRLVHAAADLPRCGGREGGHILAVRVPQFNAVEPIAAQRRDLPRKL